MQDGKSPPSRYSMFALTGKAVELQRARFGSGALSAGKLSITQVRIDANQGRVLVRAHGDAAFSQNHDPRFNGNDVPELIRTA